MVTATVREWNDEEGWGVLDSSETPNGCFGHYSDIQLTGYRTLSSGQQVDLTWEDADLFDSLAEKPGTIDQLMRGTFETMGTSEG